MVTLINLRLAQIESVAASKSGMLASRSKQSCYKKCHSGFAVAAGNAHYRDTAIVVIGEKVIDNCLANRPGCTHSRFDVHEQTRTGIHFDDGSALFGKGTGNILGYKINTGNVQSNNAGSERGRRSDAGMNRVRYIESMVAVALNQNFVRGWRYGVDSEALANDFHYRYAVYANQIQRMIFGYSTAWIGINLIAD